MKTQTSDCEKMFVKHTSDKGLVSKIYKNPSSIIKQITQPKHMQKFEQMENKHMKWCLILVIREKQITTVIYYYISTRMAKIKKNFEHTMQWWSK